MNSYELKQQEKKERLLNAAKRASERSRRAYERADLSEEKSGIVFGQPILVGHHSEARHRKAIARSNAAMQKCVDESNRASDLETKAAAVGTGGISSDDPDAIAKINEKLKGLKESHKFMIVANKALRKTLKKHLVDSCSAVSYFSNLLDDFKQGYGEKYGRELLKPDCHGSYGFAPYKLSNSSANIKRMTQRVKSLEAAAKRKPKVNKFEGFSIVENIKENRIQFLFDEKPSETIRILMKKNGFRYAPSQKAWQRHLNNNGIYAARRVISQLKDALSN